MKLNDKTLNRIYISNTIFITMQALAAIIGAVTTVCTDVATFIPFLFIPTAFYVLYNIVVQNLIDYGYYYKEYKELTKYTCTIGYRIFKKTKYNNDVLGHRLKLQSYITTVIAVANIFAQLILIYIYHPEIIG